MSSTKSQSRTSKKHRKGGTEAEGSVPRDTAPLRTSLERQISTSSTAGIPSEMMESFTSDMSRKSASTTDNLPRGRKVHRSTTLQSVPLSVPLTDNISSAITLPRVQQSSMSRERAARIARIPSQSRTRSVVFLSIWVFLGLTRIASFPNTSILSSVDTDTGEYISPIAWKATSSPLSSSSQSTLVFNEYVKPHIHTLSLSSPSPMLAALSFGRRDDFPEDHVHPDLEYEKLAGRVSAWICAVFYLTSRMPQIWKNFRRRSVEGLSSLLFVAAFHGNLFYVLSVVTSPLVQEEEGYLIESIPFLLGSGGTLAFDIMILMQSCIYRKGSTRRDHIRRRMKGIDAEGEGENDGLLANEEAGVDQEVTQDTDARTIRAASTRTRSTSLVRPRSTSVSNGWPAPTDNNPAADLR
ncbi:MAG: hypothetical protein CYPHOPRED_003917 [Cyphobasidiales sp. Tagirdzhanova-0007]|nr:MAG: hypothetical protein CYPHOPRED_003917 [Cyphobasidiales sp. Tagirdzhanova-0007]